MDSLALATALNKMNLEQLRDVNRLVVNQIRYLHAKREAAAIAKFKVGDLIEFVDNRVGRKIRAQVDRINAKSLGCHEVDGSRMPWRVSPNLCRLVGA